MGRWAGPGRTEYFENVMGRAGPGRAEILRFDGPGRAAAHLLKK